MDNDDEQLRGERRLRGSGFGSIIGGIALIVLAIAFSFTVTSTIVLLGGLLSYVRERYRGDVTGVSLGIVAVGGIGLLEATVVILGFDAFLLGAFAVGAGVFDIMAGRLFGTFRSRHQ